ncbi:MAG TPA: hypothetical protein VN963_09240, partial [bacterium]|nr:hypothetical protein [bacterium]
PPGHQLPADFDLVHSQKSGEAGKPVNPIAWVLRIVHAAQTTIKTHKNPESFEKLNLLILGKD